MFTTNIRRYVYVFYPAMLKRLFKAFTTLPAAPMMPPMTPPPPPDLFAAAFFLVATVAGRGAGAFLAETFFGGEAFFFGVTFFFGVGFFLGVGAFFGGEGSAFYKG
jgi:hypothetical protein